MYNLNKIKVGELKYPIKIYTKEIKKDKYGVNTEVLNIKCNRKAKIKNTSLSKIAALGITNIDGMDFIFRYVELDDTEVIEYNNKKYNIKNSIDLYSDKTFVLATCERVK